MKKVLSANLNQEIGINYDNPVVIKPAKLVSVDHCFFSIIVPNGNIYIFPYSSIAHVIKNKNGIGLRKFFSKKKFPLIVKVIHSCRAMPM